MNPNNPYLQVLSQMQQGQSANVGGPTGPATLGRMAPQGAPAMQGGMPGGAALGGTPAVPGRGQTAPTKFLLSALQALHLFSQQVTDPQEAQIIRSIIVLLSGLIQRDQQRQQQTGGAGMGGFPRGGLAGGNPGMTPQGTAAPMMR